MQSKKVGPRQKLQFSKQISHAYVTILAKLSIKKIRLQ